MEYSVRREIGIASGSVITLLHTQAFATLRFGPIHSGIAATSGNMETPVASQATISGVDRVPNQRTAKAVDSATAKCMTTNFNVKISGSRWMLILGNVFALPVVAASTRTVAISDVSY